MANTKEQLRIAKERYKAKAGEQVSSSPAKSSGGLWTSDTIRQKQNEARSQERLANDYVGALGDLNKAYSSWQDTDTMSSIQRSVGSVADRLNERVDYLASTDLTKQQRKNKTLDSNLAVSSKFKNDIINRTVDDDIRTRNSTKTAANTMSKQADSLKELSNYYSQWDSKDSYDADRKYKSLSYEQVQKLLSGSDLSDYDRNYLENYGADGRYTSPIDYDKDIAARENSKSQWTPIVSGISQGDTPYTFREDMKAPEETTLDKVKANRNVAAVDNRFDYYKGYMNAPDYEAKSLYNPATKDYTYRLINTGEGDAFDTYQSLAQYMTDDEKGVYNYLYQTDKDKAKKYLEKMVVTTDKRMTAADDARAKAMAADQSTGKNILDTILSVAPSIAGNIMGGASNIVNAIQGKEVNPYSATNRLSNAISSYREGMGDQISNGSNVAKFLYDTGVSMLDTLGGMGAAKLGADVYGMSMGLGAAQQQMKELKDSGASDSQVLIGGSLSGIAEGFFEEYSLEKLLEIKDVESIGRLFKSFATQAFTEGSEEVFTEIANIIIDGLNRGSMSDYNRSVEAYMAQGMSESEARSQATKDMAKQVALAGLGGAISGGVLGGIEATGSFINNKVTGSKAKNEISDTRLVEAAKNLPSDSEFNQSAQKYNADKLTDAQRGSLLNHVGEETVNNAYKAFRSETATEEDREKAVNNLLNLNNISLNAAERTAASGSEGISTGTQNFEGKVINTFTKGDEQYIKTTNGVMKFSDAVMSKENKAAVGYATQITDRQERIAFLSNYDGKTDITEYVNAFNYVYRLGVLGMNKSKVNVSNFTKEQIDNIYSIGREATETARVEVETRRQQEAEADEKIASELVSKYFKVTGEYKTGTYDTTALEGVELTREQRLAITVGQKLHEAMGAPVNVKYFVSEKDENGNFNAEQGRYENGTIYVDAMAGFKNLSEGSTQIMQVLSHELTHWAEKKAPLLYKQLSDTVLDALAAERGVTRDNVIATEIKNLERLYKDNGIDSKVDEKLAISELVARASEGMLTDEKAFEKYTENMAQNQKVRFAERIQKLFSKLRDFFRGLASKFETKSSEWKELNRQADLMEQAKEKWAAMIEKAVRVGQAEKAAGEFKEDSNSMFAIRTDFYSEFDEWVKNDFSKMYNRALNDANYLDSLKNRKQGRRFWIGTTSSTLQGAGAIESDVYMTEAKIVVDLVEHPELAIDDIKKIPKILEKPALALKSKNVGRQGMYNDRLVLIGNEKSSEEGYAASPLVVALSLGNYGMNDMYFESAQKIVSLYPKTVGVKNLIKNSFIVYADTKKATRLLKSIGFSTPINLVYSGFIGKIISNINGTVNIKGERFDDVFTDDKGRKLYSLRDSEGNNLTEQQAEYFKDSKVRDEDGNLRVVHHGTIREFYTFSRSFANSEGDMGKGFYFTSDETDVEANYANENGADLTNKIEVEADRLENEEEYEDMEHDEIVDMLRKKYITSSEPITLDCYLNIQNPCYVGANQTYLFEDVLADISEDDYESEDEYYDAQSEKIDEVLSDIDDVLYDNGFEAYVDDINTIISENMYAGITLETLKQELSGKYIEDEEGNYASNEVARLIVEALGYDGIIDSSVSRKFKNMNMSSDTTHYIVFDSNQAKLTTNENPTTNEDIRYSLRDSEYLSLAKNPEQNEAKLREMVEAAAKEAGAITEKGKPVIFYHGTRSRHFNSFDSEKSANGWSGYGFYFTDRKSFAENYTSGYGEVYQTYLTANKMAKDYDHEITLDMVKSLLSELGLSEDSAEAQTLLYDYASNINFGDLKRDEALKVTRRFDDMLSYIGDREVILRVERLLSGLKYSKEALLNKVSEWSGYDGLKSSREVALFKNTDIKSADLVTYDNDGNIIPLSERFQSDNEDIRYSMRDGIGYHAGDLGKAEYLSIQGYGRGTGHFGTGTYFVGEEEKINGDTYGKRPHHAVNFNDYNLYKVPNDEIGYALHDFLKVVDGGIKPEWIQAVKNHEYSPYKAYGDREGYGYDTAGTIAYYKDKAKEYDIDVLSEDEFAKENDIQLGVKRTDSYKKLKDEYANNIENYIKNLPDSAYETVTYEYEDTQDSLDEKYSDYLKEEVEKGIDKLNSRFREFDRGYFKLHFYKSFDGIDGALDKVVEYQKSADRSSKADSYATVFMKALGYEGIDVRGTGLDNTKYGSVIYDIKPDTVLYSLRQQTPDLVGETDKLRKQNERLQEDVNNLKERLKLEKRLTNGQIADKEAIRKIASKLIKENGLKYDANTLTDELTDIFNETLKPQSEGDFVPLPDDDFFTIADNEPQGLEGKISALARSLAGSIKSTEEVPDTYRDLLDTIRKTTFYVTETEYKDAVAAAGGKAELSRMLRGKIKITTTDKNEYHLDSFLSEYAEEYRDIFKYNSEGEHLTDLLDTYNDMREAVSVVKTYYDMEAENYFKAELLNMAWQLPAIKTTADKWKAKVDALRLEHSKMMQETRQEYRDKARQSVKDQREADAIYYGRVINKLREQRNASYAAGRAYGKQRLDAYKDRQARQAEIKKITDKAKTLINWYNTNNKDKHIAKVMQAPVRNFLEALDFSSEQLLGKRGGEKAGTPTQRDISLAKAFRGLANFVGDANGQNAKESDVKSQLNTYLDIPMGYQESLNEISDKLEALAEKRGDNVYVLNDLSLDELIEVRQDITILKSLVTNVNRLIANASYANCATCAQNTIRTADAMSSNGKGKGRFSDFMNWTTVLPYYAFQRFGEGGQSIFAELMDGYSKFAFKVKEVFDFENDIFGTKEEFEDKAHDWSREVHEVEVKEGKKIKITTAQLMSLYCINKRELRLRELWGDKAPNHLRGGGIKVADIKDSKNNISQAGDTGGLSETTIENMTGILTDEQRAVADKLQHFMTTTCSDWGNETSMKRFGIDSFTEDMYFPIKSDENNIATEANDNENSLFRLLNMSFTKSLTKGANNAVTISNIFDVFVAHTTDMAKYNSLAIPVLDAFKWLSYTEKTEKNKEGSHDTVSLKASLERAFGGKAAETYIKELLKDLNASQKSGRDEALSHKLMSNAKVAAVAFNLRVAALQPTAYFRASAVLSASDMLAGFAKPSSYKKAQEWSGMAYWKSLGLYDINIQKSVTDMLKGEKTLKDKIVDLGLKGAEWGDKLTWGHILNACEHNIKRNNPDMDVNSDAFKQAVAKKFDEVVVSTQVIDTPLTKTQIMRSKGGFAKLATNFMAEPMVSLNIFTNAVHQFKDESARVGKGQALAATKGLIVKSASAYIITATANAIAEALMDALRAMVDEDDDDFAEAFAMKYRDNFWGNFVEDMSLLSKIPYAKELYSIFRIGDLAEWMSSEAHNGTLGDTSITKKWMSLMSSSYSSSRMDTQVFDTARKSIVAFYKALDTNEIDYKKVYSWAQLVSQATGIPVSSAFRDFRVVWNDFCGSLGYDSMKLFK